MSKRLIDLDLTRIDRVGKGSNPGSKVLLYKSAATTGEKKDLLEAPASEEGEATVPITRDDFDEETLALFAEVEKERDDAVAKAEEVTAEIEALKEATADEEQTIDDPAELAKSDDLPEPVRKALEDAAEAKAEIAKMRDEADTVRFREVAKSLGHSGDEADEIGGVFKMLAKSVGEDSDEYKTVLRVHKAAQAQSEKAMEQLSQPSGQTGVQYDGGNVDQIVTLARAHQVEHGVSYKDALTAVRQANPNLVSDIEKARLDRAGK